MSIYTINGHNLTLELIQQILEDPAPCVKMAPEAEERCRQTRTQIDRWLEKGAPAIYGVNTGLGALKDVAVPAEKHEEWNRTLSYPHSASFGGDLPPAVTRLSLLLRANVICLGYSASRPELAERLLDLFNAGIAPAVIAEGCTGLGDLAPMAQCVMVVAGLPESRAYYQGQLMPGREACRKAGLPEEFTLQCKEALTQISGGSMGNAIAIEAYLRCKKSLQELSAQMQPGTAGEEKCRAWQESLDFIGAALELECNVDSDNPLLFEVEDGQYEAVMGCNSSNTQTGYTMDLLSILLAEMGAEAASLHPTSQQQYQSKQLKFLSAQVSGDSIPTKGGQEDHVEFSYTAALKAAWGAEILEKMVKDASGLAS